MMQSPNNFIVRPVEGKRYSNTKNIGGIDFVVSTSEEDHKFSNRLAEVIELPLRYSGPVRKGDQLIVHHNAFKFYNDMYGRRKSGKSFLREDLFLIDDLQFYAYKSDGVWSAVDKYCFVLPVPVKESVVKKNVTYEPLVGKMAMSNERLRSLGVDDGDIVGFTPESEYEFTVDDEVMYRVFDSQISLKLS